MRILHTADWHLGKRLDYFSRHEEQVKVMNEICRIAEEHISQLPTHRFQLNARIFFL